MKNTEAPSHAPEGSPALAKKTPVKVKKRPAARIGDGSCTRKRGFASMDAEKQRQIASQGGKASYAGGLGHKWTDEEAKQAGRKGGLASRRGPAKPKD